MRFLMLTGLSGSGKATAMRLLEDMGALCVDNLPPLMISQFIDTYAAADDKHEVIAFTVDVRGGSLFDAVRVRDAVSHAQDGGHRVEVLYMDAEDNVLLERYKETRREHPLASDDVSLTDAIVRERDLLQPLRESANHLIDTTGLKAKDLHAKLRELLRSDHMVAEMPFRLEVMSFGFKRGIPRQADLVFDVRFLPNPFYIVSLRRHSGLDEDVREFVMQHPVTMEFMRRTTEMLDFLLPHYREEGKKRLVIAIGCTGGAHRSVAITEAVGSFLRDRGYRVETHHRDLEIEQAHWNDIPEDA